MNLRTKWLWCLAIVLAWGAGALAQSEESDANSEPPPLSEGSGGDTTTAKRLVEDPLGSGDVTLQMLNAGIGGGSSGLIRPGEWTGFQLEVTDRASKPRQLLVRLDIPDADGDICQPTTEVAGQGLGKSIPTWIYTQLPFDLGQGTVLRFVAHESVDGRPGRLLGTLPFQISGAMVPEAHAMVAVVGAAMGGLDQYNASRLRGEGAAPAGHEATQIISGILPQGLPDRWMGLAGFEAVVWTGSSANETPDRLSAAQADSIREWVRRGGHLIVVLPSVFQQWIGGAAGVSPLADILPAVRVQSLEGVDLAEYRDLLNSDDTVPLPKNAMVRTFIPDNAGPFDAMPIMSNARGQPVVIRRLVGSGAVTLVGIDVTSKSLQERKGAIDAVVFWNHILGKRLQLPPQAEINKAPPAGSNSPPKWSVRRNPNLMMDQFISEAIGKSAKAAKGLLVAFVLFLAYWLLAGPLGYLFLKQKRRQHHAWLAFTGVTATFALLGWSSTNLLRMGRDVDRHITLLDHVYGQSNQRMRSWIELTLPKYGEQTVSVAASREGSSFDWHNTLSAWRAFGDISAIKSFPDARGYRVDSRKPDSAAFPARATTRQLQIDIAGSVPADWQMPHPLAAEGVETGREIWIEDGVGERGWTIHGQVVHKLPAALRNVYVIVVRGQRPPRLRNLFPAEAWMVKSSPWDPNQPLDLESVLPKESGRKGVEGANNEFLQLRGNSGNAFIGNGITATARVELERGLMGSSLLSMLEPPDELATGEVPWCYRTSMHTWDLGRWFTQPCVMIVGILGTPDAEGVECPVPVSLDSSPSDAVRKAVRGVTLVRWIYPLSPRPPAVRGVAASSPEELPEPSPAVTPTGGGGRP